MRCEEQVHDVAPATAYRICDAGRGTWSMPTEKVKLLMCTGGGNTEWLAPSPGIEEVKLASCGDPDDAALRRVAADRSVAPAQAP